jgi:hypothetical protein
MAATKTTKFRATANPEYAAAMHGLRSSSAASPQDNRPNRQRTRSTAKRQAIKNGW